MKVTIMLHENVTVMSRMFVKRIFLLSMSCKSHIPGIACVPSRSALLHEFGSHDRAMGCSEMATTGRALHGSSVSASSIILCFTQHSSLSGKRKRDTTANDGRLKDRQEIRKLG